MATQNEKTTAALLHLSAFAKYLIPFAGIVAPLIIWQTKKHASTYVDETGKSVINFHLSTLLYSTVLVIIVGILFLGNIINYIEIEQAGGEIVPINLIILGIVSISILGIWTLIEIILIILGSVKANEGAIYRYPLTIPFLK